METLKEKISVEKYVSELNGFLNAISQLNDEIGYRHSFSADLIYSNDENVLDQAAKYLRLTVVELKEIDTKEELKIIQHHIFNNFFHSHDNAREINLPFIKEQLGWHVQEYISLAAINKRSGKRWHYSKRLNNEETDVIFIQINDGLVVLYFYNRIER